MALPVVRRFVERVKEKAVGVAVTPGVRPMALRYDGGVNGWFTGSAFVRINRR